jgi:multicomponent Na+:H+ antiporter subunit C
VKAVVAELFTHFNYYGYIVLTLIGFYAMITRASLVRQLIGLTVFQTGIILFFISAGAKWGAGLPIAPDGSGPGGAAIDPAAHSNPLPHALMLTAIVVAVATQGVAMALLIRIKRDLGTLDEDELVEKMQRDDEALREGAR